MRRIIESIEQLTKHTKEPEIKDFGVKLIIEIVEQSKKENNASIGCHQ